MVHGVVGVVQATRPLAHDARRMAVPSRAPLALLHLPPPPAAAHALPHGRHKRAREHPHSSGGGVCERWRQLAPTTAPAHSGGACQWASTERCQRWWAWRCWWRQRGLGRRRRTTRASPRLEQRTCPPTSPTRPGTAPRACPASTCSPTRRWRRGCVARRPPPKTPSSSRRPGWRRAPRTSWR